MASKLHIGTGMKRLLLAWLCLPAAVSAQPGSPFVPLLDDPAILYYSEPHDPVALLSSRLSKGEATLEFKSPWGYLESVLRELKVPVSSQTLVFSKTSLQVARISPDHPRALYFSDDVYVGMVRGGLLEFTAVDPEKGAVFYVLDNKPSPRPLLQRRNEDCLKCHFTVNTMRVPGFLTRSVYADSAGEPLMASGSYLTDQNSPLAERWGGWYVTGSHGDARHMGNEIAKGRTTTVDREHGANVTDLKGRVNVAQYPSPSSDIVALMVLNHQVRMHNLITLLGYQARLNRPELPATIQAAVRYLLFADEPQLRSPVAGTAPFRAEFEARGPSDSKGRSLRQMDLNHRLFRYPCSFLIYSEGFEALPANAKDPLYKRLFEVLSGKDSSETFRALTSADRRAILEILVATKASLPGYFRDAL
jgi:hypothetical protein